MRNFRDLEIWQSGIDLVKEVYAILELFPKTEKFGRSSQLARCAVSIPSNIAEGSARESQKDFSRFLQISLGSSNELETQLLIACEVGYISQIEFSGLMKKLNKLQKGIHALKKYVDTKT